MKTIKFKDVTIDLKTKGKLFLGLGRIQIRNVIVRNGDLPIRPFIQTIDGLEYDRYELIDVRETGNEAVIRTRALATSGSVQICLDHSLDPIWSTRPWDGRIASEDRMDWVLRPFSMEIAGRNYRGLKYEFRFSSREKSIYFILDRATWEIGGKAAGNTLLRQQMSTDPIARIRSGTAYSTSGRIEFKRNPVMTHDYPRWAGEQGFDYQYRNGDALIGMFSECGLIKTILEHAPGENSIRHFDKHIFNYSNRASTTPKFIGLARGIGDDTDHLNEWTRVFDSDQDRVLGQFGMHRPGIETLMDSIFWDGKLLDTYRREILPAAEKLGVQRVYIDSFWESEKTKRMDGRQVLFMNGNQCCPHEYVVAEVLGGAEGYRRLADEFRQKGIELQCWIGSHQSVNSPLISGKDAPYRNQLIRMSNGRHCWKSGYEEIAGMDLNGSFGKMFSRAAVKAARETGIYGILYDSFFNFGFMPVNYYHPDPKKLHCSDSGWIRPRTQWRALLKILSTWQKAGLNIAIESLGPWGHGQIWVDSSYRKPLREALAYQCSVGFGNSVIPTNSSSENHGISPQLYYRFLANKAPLVLPHHINGTRIDKTSSAPEIRRMNMDYRRAGELMYSRSILPGQKGVLWSPSRGKKKVLFAFRNHRFSLSSPASVTCITTGQVSKCTTGAFRAEQMHTYILE